MIQRIQHILFHRHLIIEFLRRDLQARYIGSAMGFFWSVIHPLILLLVYTFAFGVILQAYGDAFGSRHSGITGFAFYVFSGILPWYALQEALVRSTTSIVDNAHLIKQVRFPAKVLPAYLTLSSLVNQLIGTAIFLIFILIVEGILPMTLLAFPLALAIEFVLIFGLGLLFATLNTYIRDIAPLVTIGVMVLMWATPLFYMLDKIQNASFWVKLIIYGNPMSYMVMIHHDIFFYFQWPPLSHWAIFGGFALLSFAAGYTLFTRCHSEFADLL